MSSGSRSSSVRITSNGEADGSWILSGHNSCSATTAFRPHAYVVAVDGQGWRWLIWPVIDVGGHMFANPVYAQLWYGVRALVNAPYSVLFAVKAPRRSLVRAGPRRAGKLRSGEGAGPVRLSIQALDDLKEGLGWDP